MAYSIDYRKRVIAYVKEGKSKLEAARVFKVNPDTIYEWIKRGDDLKSRVVPVRQRKLDKTQLLKDVKQHPDRLLHEHATAHGVHPSSLSRALARLSIVKKTAALH
jgi:transposase